MSEIVEFIEARLAEDEAVARAATPGAWEWLDGKLVTAAGQWIKCQYRCTWAESSPVHRGPRNVPGHEHYRVDETVIDSSADYGYESGVEVSDTDASHIARHDPARTLREVAAKRVIVKSIETLVQRAYGYDSAGTIESELAPLAAAYSDHRDFNEEWRS